MKLAGRGLAAMLLVASTVAWCAGIAGEPQPAATGTTVILVRHAEKTAQAPDPALSERGLVRAQELAWTVQDAGVSAIYATQYRRTQETVAPAAERLGLPIAVAPVEGGHLVRYAEGFVQRLLDAHRGETILVAGHSNTIPAMLKALGISPAPVITEHDYHDLFVVTVPAVGGASLVHLRYGDVSGDAPPTD